MRFNRTGKKNRVSYRIVLQEHTAAPGKRHVEILGSHDPHTKTTVLREERIKHWLKEGVQASDAVYNLLVSQGLVTGAKRVKKMARPVSPEPVEVVAEDEAVVTEAVPEAEEAPAPDNSPEGSQPGREAETSPTEVTSETEAPVVETEIPTEPSENPADNEAGEEAPVSTPQQEAAAESPTPESVALEAEAIPGETKA